MHSASIYRVLGILGSPTHLQAVLLSSATLQGLQMMQFRPDMQTAAAVTLSIYGASMTRSHEKANRESLHQKR